MKVGIITKTNQKGQLVIPKEMRQTLGIDTDVPLNLILEREGIYIYPVDEVVAKLEKENSYVDILKKTQGTWSKEGWSAVRRKREKIETVASKRRKQIW